MVTRAPLMPCSLATMCLFCATYTVSAQEPNRTVLPIAPPPFRGTVGHNV